MDRGSCAWAWSYREHAIFLLPFFSDSAKTVNFRLLVRAARETSEFQNWSQLTNLTAITWLKYCRYGVKRYPINQSSTLSIYITMIAVIISECNAAFLCIKSMMGQLICKCEPFWQEVSVETLVLRWLIKHLDLWFKWLLT